MYTIKFVIFLLCIILMHLLFSTFGYVLSDYTFKECYRNQYHIIALILIYWWCPFIFINEDIDEYYNS